MEPSKLGGAVVNGRAADRTPTGEGADAAFPFPLFAIMVIGCWYADAEASIARATANFIMMTCGFL